MNNIDEGILLAMESNKLVNNSCAEWIRAELESLTKRFPNIKVRYEYNCNARTHTIEIVPKDIYYSNKDYIAWEGEIFDKFISNYPDENICFVSDDALVGIENGYNK